MSRRKSINPLGETWFGALPFRISAADFGLLFLVALATLFVACGGRVGSEGGGGGAVGTAPTLTSADHTTFAEDAESSFAVTTRGSPTPSISLTGELPSGVTLTDKGNGTATLSGKPATGSHGVYSTNITANNGVLPNGIQSFTVNVNSAASAIAFPLRASSNGRYLVDRNNMPVLLLGDSPQPLLVNLNPSDTAAYISDRHARGFNAILVMVVCDAATAGKANGDTFDGIPPFTTGSSPSDYDLSMPNPTYFARLDSLVSMAAADGLVVVLDPIETAGWRPTLEHNGATKAFNYGAFLGSRYRNSPNIIWQSGNDFQAWKTNATANNLVFQIMAGIKSTDPNHLQTVELDFNVSYSNQDIATLRPVLTMNAAYTYFETYDVILQAYNSSPVLPVFLTESNYEYENNTQGFVGVTGPFVLREQEYWTMTSGGCGQLYGNHYTYAFAAGWRNFLGSPGTLELAYWNKLFNSIQWWNLVPDQSHQVVTSGFGTYSAGSLNLPLASYTSTAWITDGSVAVSYDPAGRSLTVNLAKFKAPVSAAWYDPTNGTFASIAGSPLSNSGSRSFSPPGLNYRGDTDWVLVFEVNSAFASKIARSRRGPHAAGQNSTSNDPDNLRR